MARTLDHGTLTLQAASGGDATAVVTAVTDPRPVQFRARPRALADPAVFIPGEIPFGEAAGDRVVHASAVFVRSSQGASATEQVGSVLSDTVPDADLRVRTSAAAPSAPTRAWVILAVHGGHPQDITIDWELLGPTHGTLAVALAGLAGGGGAVAANKR